MSNTIVFIQKKVDSTKCLESRPEEENGYDWDSEANFDTIGDGSYYALTNINTVIETLQALKEKGANYVEIESNIDHQELEITGYEYRQVNEEERREYFLRKEEILKREKEEKIQKLERQLKDLKEKI